MYSGLRPGRYLLVLRHTYLLAVAHTMSPKFEQAKKTDHGGARERGRIHDARWADRQEDKTAGSAVGEADISMAEIYQDKRQLAAYRNVGSNQENEQEGAKFQVMMDKWEGKKELTEEDRNMRERVRMEFVTRMGIAKSCEKLLTKDIFKGLGDASSVVNRLVGELGEEWALALMKPRLIMLVGLQNGTAELTELWQALRNFHGVYETRGFKKVYSRIEKYRQRYGIEPQKWAEIQRGGNLGETANRAFGEFQKQHGFLGRIFHGIPNAVSATKIGFAGRREERNGQMKRLREERSKALEILEKIMGPDFQKIVDEAILTGDRPQSEERIKQKEEKDAKLASGLTEKDIAKRVREGWADKLGKSKVKDNDANFNKWINGEFMPAYEREANEQTEGSWISQMIISLFSIRLKNIKRPGAATATP